MATPGTLKPHLISVFLPGATKTVIKATPGTTITAQLQKICQQRGLPYEKLAPRLVDGSSIPLDAPCDDLDQITLFDKDNFEEEMASDLTSAAWSKQVESVKFMLNLPCFNKILNAYNARGQSALFCAARQGATDVVIELLKCSNINVNIQVPSHGGTPLHAASFAQAGEVVALLLSQGADINLKNKQGMTARQEANGSEVIKVYKLLDKGGIAAITKEYPSIIALNAMLGDRVKVVNELASKVDANTISIEQYKSARATELTPEMMATWNQHFTEKLEILDLSPIEIAQQITLIDHSLFNKVRPYELTGFAKADPDKTPNIFESTMYFNLVGAWVATEILKKHDAKKRTVVLSYTVENLIKYNNINSSFAIQLGLRAPALFRMNETFSGISEYLQQYIHMVMDLCTTEKNFAKLREHVAKHQYPGIPYLGLFTKDMLFIHEGNKDGEAKDKLSEKVIDEVGLWQKSIHPFQAYPRIQHMIMNAFTMTPEDQYDLSLLYEPRPVPNQDNKAKEEKKKENLVAAKKLLEEHEKKEAAHWAAVNQKLNLLSMIETIKSCPTDCKVPCSEGDVETNSLFLKPRCIFLLNSLNGTLSADDKEKGEKVKELLSSATKKTVESLMAYLSHDEPVLDNLNPGELFKLYDISQALSLEVLANKVHLFAIGSQTYHNVIEFTLSQLIALPSCVVWPKTLKILTKRLDIVQKSEHKDKLEEAIKTWSAMEDKEPEVMVPPSTWAEDFKKILDRTYFTDLQFNVKDINGASAVVPVHRGIVYSQTKVSSMRNGTEIINLAHVNYLTNLPQLLQTSPASGKTKRRDTALDAPLRPTQSLDQHINRQKGAVEITDDDGKPIHDITVPVPLSVFMKIIKFAYSRHFGELQADEETYIFATAREYGRMRRALTNPRFGFYNNVAISALLTSQLQNLSDRKSSKVTAAAKEVKDLSGCAVIVSNLSLKFGKVHPLTKLFMEQQSLVTEQHTLLQPLLEQEKTKLRKKITELEKKLQKLEAENNKLRLSKGLSISPLTRTISDEDDDSSPTAEKKRPARGFTVC